jgi:hypothetical protein
MTKREYTRESVQSRDGGSYSTRRLRLHVTKSTGLYTKSQMIFGGKGDTRDRVQERVGLTARTSSRVLSGNESMAERCL